MTNENKAELPWPEFGTDLNRRSIIQLQEMINILYKRVVELEKIVNGCKNDE